MRGWSITLHFLLGALLLAILPLIMRAQEIRTPYALDRIPQRPRMTTGFSTAS